MSSDQLLDEAKAFDDRVFERVQNGLVPDLQNAAKVDWFFNNPWRRPEYIDMVFGDYLRFACQYLSIPSTVLEIGSGLGHMSLELARKGHRVTGLELSPVSVKIATAYLNKCERGSTFGNLQFVNADFMQWEAPGKFDAICCFLTLHHFADPLQVIEKISGFLKPLGKIFVIEPARDLFSKRNASLVALIRLLLSINGNWHENLSLPTDTQSLDDLCNTILQEYREAKDKNEKEQSPNDNSSYASTILEGLNKYFDQQDLTYGNTISPRLLGGVRAPRESEAIRIATFIKLFDEYATSQGIIEPGVFYYAGKLK